MRVAGTRSVPATLKTATAHGVCLLPYGRFPAAPVLAVQLLASHWCVPATLRTVPRCTPLRRLPSGWYLVFAPPAAIPPARFTPPNAPMRIACLTLFAILASPSRRPLPIRSITGRTSNPCSSAVLRLPRALAQKSKLRSIAAPGCSIARVVVPGKSAESALFLRISSEDARPGCRRKGTSSNPRRLPGSRRGSTKARRFPPMMHPNPTHAITGRSGPQTDRDCPRSPSPHPNQQSSIHNPQPHRSIRGCGVGEAGIKTGRTGRQEGSPASRLSRPDGVTAYCHGDQSVPGRLVARRLREGRR